VEASHPAPANSISDEIGRVQHEHLAHQIRLLLVAAHEPDHPAAGRLFDDLFEALAHQLLELHPLFDHRRAAAALAEGLLDLGVAAAQDADDEIVLVIGLCLGWTATVELLQQRDQSIGDRGQLLAMVAFRLRRRQALRGIVVRSRDTMMVDQPATMV